MKTFNSEKVTVTNIRLTIRRGNWKEFLQTIGPLTQRIRKETGCLTYRVYEERGDENTVILIEEWSSEANWRNHRKGRNFAALLGMVSVLSIRAEIDFKLLSQIGGNELIRDT